MYVDEAFLPPRGQGDVPGRRLRGGKAAGYFTIGILVRSIVIATATMSTAPNTIC